MKAWRWWMPILLGMVLGFVIPSSYFPSLRPRLSAPSRPSGPLREAPQLQQNRPTQESDMLQTLRGTMLAGG